MPVYKTHLIDRVPMWAAALLTVAYIFIVVVCIGVGAAGPTVVESTRVTRSSIADTGCTPLTVPTCNPTVSVSFLGLSGLNQALWLRATIMRPNDTSTGQPALMSQTITFGQTYSVTAYAIGDNGALTRLVTNVTKSAVFTCPAGNRECGSALLLAQTFLYYRDYYVTATFYTPAGAFVGAGVPAANLINNTSAAGASGVEVALYGGYLRAAYTRFQLAGKYTFFVLTIVILMAYALQLGMGKGSKDPRNGTYLTATTEQTFTLVLAGLLIWYNDPTFAANVAAPSFVASGFYAVCAVTFLAVLMLYWLVMFDLNRTARGDGSSSTGGGATASLAQRFHCSAITAALCFWLPKMVWITISWLLVLAYYMIQRAAWLTDPTFSIFDSFPYLAQFFFSFIAAWGGLSVIYLGVLIIMALYNCRVIAPSGRYLLGITLATIIMTLIGYFSNSVLNSNGTGTSILFMVAYGSANAYVWFLMIAFMPAIAYSPSELDAAVSRADTGAAKEAAPYGGVPEGMRLIGAGVDATTQTEEEDAEWGRAGVEAEQEYTGASASKHASRAAAPAPAQAMFTGESFTGATSSADVSVAVDADAPADAGDEVAWK